MAYDNMESRNELFFSADTEELKKRLPGKR